MQPTTYIKNIYILIILTAVIAGWGISKLLSDDIYDYKGVYVAGSHAVKEDGVWMRVEDSKIGKPLNDGNMH